MTVALACGRLAGRFARSVVAGGCTLGALVWLVGCSSALSDLETARNLYRDARYEAAAAWLDALEPQAVSMSTKERATLYYLRGMTAYRLAQYQEALHELALAAATVRTQAESLTPTQRSMLERTLAELTPRDASANARVP